MNRYKRVREIAQRLGVRFEPRKPVHPMRAHIHDERTFGERVADGMAAMVGSWAFVMGRPRATRAGS